MKKVSKLLALVLTLVLALSLTACGGQTDVPAENPNSGVTTPDDEQAFARGTVDGQVYTSEFLGLQCTVPEGWTYLNDEQIEQLNGIAVETVTDEDIANQMQQSMDSGNQIYDMQVMSPDNTHSVNIILAKLGALGSLVSASTFADAGAQQLPATYESMGATDVVVERAQIDFLGSSCEGILSQGVLNGVQFYNNQLCLQMGEYVCIVTFSSSVEDTSAEMQAFFSAIG